MSRPPEVVTVPSTWARVGYTAACRLGVWLARLYWRLEVHGADRVPSSGGFVVAPVHRSNVDFLLAALLMPRRVRWMAKHTIFKGGLVDWFLTTFGAFPVNRDTADRAALETCERLLAAGEAVVMFPEGRRREGPVVEHVYDGPAFVSCRQRVPIVPVGIAGSERAMPIGHKMVRPARVVVEIGEPIYPDVLLTGRVPRSTVRALSERLRAEVQRCYDAAKLRL